MNTKQEGRMALARIANMLDAANAADADIIAHGLIEYADLTADYLADPNRTQRRPAVLLRAIGGGRP